MEDKNKIRVLIVDDSLFMRKLLKDLINSSEEIEVVGEAKNGFEAIGEAIRLKPDVITMDFNMPELDGAQTTEKILNGTENSPAIIMLSAYTKKGTEETFKSLNLGAVDFITKPSGELSLDVKTIKDEIIEKIKAASTAKIIKDLKANISNSNIKKCDRKTPAHIIIIGSSTGGPPIVENIISRLPEDLKSTVIIAQHMPKYFTKHFSERLNKMVRIYVKEAENGDEIKPNMVLVAPGSCCTVVEKNTDELKGNILKINEEPDEKKLTPSIDALMSSAAKIYKDGVVGIILTGMGSDGTEGMKEIKKYGGHTIAQDPKTATIESMVCSVIDARVADEILKPDDIIERIIELSS